MLRCPYGQHPPAGIEWFMGDSRAKWDGETLVVDVVHFTDQTWLDRSGNYRDVEPNAQLLEYECAPFIEAAKNK